MDGIYYSTKQIRFEPKTANSATNKEKCYEFEKAYKVFSSEGATFI